jgi:hypothetical protein
LAIAASDEAKTFYYKRSRMGQEADAMPKEWKIKVSDDDTKLPVFQEGKPVYIDPDGKEIALDPIAMYSKIIGLGKENKKFRETGDSLKETYKIFDGIDELVDWKTKADEAISTVENFNEKDWLKADKVDKLKADMKDAYDEQVDGVKKSFTAKENDYKATISKKDLQIRTLMVSNKFATSPFFSGTEPKTNLPPEIAETYFGKHFKVEENKKTSTLNLVAYNEQGDQILSRENPGDIAGFNEAMSFIFDSYSGKDKLLRGGKPGSGGSGGQGGDGGAGEEELDKLKKQYAEAYKLSDSKAMIVLKNRIFKIEQAKKKAAA